MNQQQKPKHRIFCFINNPCAVDFLHVIAMCDDGYVLASHISSSECWAKHDIGITSEWKHEFYNEHCPDGFELVWIDNPAGDPELAAAYVLHQEIWKDKQDELHADDCLDRASNNG